AVRTKRNRIHQSFMLQNEVRRFAAGRIPYPRLRPAGGRQPPAIGTEGEAVNGGWMRERPGNQIARRGTPDFSSVVGAGRGNEAAIVAERAVQNRLLVLKCEMQASAGSLPNECAGFFTQRKDLPPVWVEARAKDFAAVLDWVRAVFARARVPNLGDAAGD